MDPNAAYAEMLSLIESGDDPERLAELDQALDQWVKRGGFDPAMATGR